MSRSAYQIHGDIGRWYSMDCEKKNLFLAGILGRCSSPDLVRVCEPHLNHDQIILSTRALRVTM